MPVARTAKAATASAAATTEGNLTLPQIIIQHAIIEIVGNSPLVTNAFNQKTIDQLLAKHMGKATSGREVKVPTDQFIGSLHVLPAIPKIDADKNPVYLLDPSGNPIYKKDDSGERYSDIPEIDYEWNGIPVLDKSDPEDVIAIGRFGFRSCGIKACCIRAANDAGMKMTDSQRAFHIPGELVEIFPLGDLAGKGPRMREDMVRVGMGTPDIRFRGEFTNWKMFVPVKFNTGVLSLEKLTNLFRLGGFGVGVGEWRLGKGGSWGGFEVVGVQKTHVETW